MLLRLKNMCEDFLVNKYIYKLDKKYNIKKCNRYSKFSR